MCLSSRDRVDRSAFSLYSSFLLQQLLDPQRPLQVTKMILKSISLPLKAVAAVGPKAEKEALHGKMASHLVRFR